MDDFELVVKQLWDAGYSISEIAMMYECEEDEIENIVEEGEG